MNELDYAILIVLLISILVGIVRGAIREILNVVGWVAGFLAAQTWVGSVSPYFAEWIQEPLPRFMLAWLLLFFVVVMTVSVLGSLIAEGVRKLGLGSLDRSMGAVVGAARGALVLVLLALVAGLTTFPRTPAWKGSTLAPWLEMSALHARNLLPDDFAKRITFGKINGQKI